MFKRAIPKATPDQQRRQDRAREAGCIACHMERHVHRWLPPEIHHQTISGRQIDQDHTVCLCVWHHRAICIPGFNTSQMTAMYGPSLAKGSKTFFARYGANDDMLQFQNNLIKHLLQ